MGKKKNSKALKAMKAQAMFPQIEEQIEKQETVEYPDVPYKMMELSPSDILVDTEYQRDFQSRKMKKMICEWNLFQFTPILVNKRKDGKYYVFDGQHRHRAWKFVYKDRPIPCLVYDGLSPEREALLFAKTNTSFSKPKPGDITKALVATGKPEEVAYRDMLDAAGVSYTWSQHGTSDRSLCCHSFLQWSIKKYGMAVVKKSLDFIRDAKLISYPSISYKSWFIGGFIDFFNTYENIDEAHFLKNLEKTGPLKIQSGSEYYIHLAGLRRTGRAENSKYVARYLVDVYNIGYGQKSEKRLSIQKLVLGTEG